MEVLFVRGGAGSFFPSHTFLSYRHFLRFFSHHHSCRHQGCVCPPEFDGPHCELLNVEGYKLMKANAAKQKFSEGSSSNGNNKLGGLSLSNEPGVKKEEESFLVMGIVLGIGLGVLVIMTANKLRRIRQHNTSVLANNNNRLLGQTECVIRRDNNHYYNNNDTTSSAAAAAVLNQMDEFKDEEVFPNWLQKTKCEVNHDLLPKLA